VITYNIPSSTEPKVFLVRINGFRYLVSATYNIEADSVDIHHVSFDIRRGRKFCEVWERKGMQEIFIEAHNVEIKMQILETLYIQIYGTI